MKTNNSIGVHPQLNNNGHPMDGALMGAGSIWPYFSIANTKLRRI
jgi:hypothetical protein